jgi:hypothetical protein
LSGEDTWLAGAKRTDFRLALGDVAKVKLTARRRWELLHALFDSRRVIPDAGGCQASQASLFLARLADERSAIPCRGAVDDALVELSALRVGQIGTRLVGTDAGGTAAQGVVDHGEDLIDGHLAITVDIAGACLRRADLCAAR